MQPELWFRSVSLFCCLLRSLLQTEMRTCRQFTWLLLFGSGELLDGAALAEAADWTGQPFSQSVPRAFGTRRAGLQRAEGRLRLKVRH